MLVYVLPSITPASALSPATLRTPVVGIILYRGRQKILSTLRTHMSLASLTIDRDASNRLLAFADFEKVGRGPDTARMARSAKCPWSNHPCARISIYCETNSNCAFKGARISACDGRRCARIPRPHISKSRSWRLGKTLDSVERSDGRFCLPKTQRPSLHEWYPARPPAIPERKHNQRCACLDEQQR